MTERASREELRKSGVDSFVKDSKVPNFEDKLAEAADDVGTLTGSSQKAGNFIRQSVKVIRRSETAQRKLRRPDIYPRQEPTAPRTGSRINYSKKYPGLVK